MFKGNSRGLGRKDVSLSAHSPLGCKGQKKPQCAYCENNQKWPVDQHWKHLRKDNTQAGEGLVLADLQSNLDGSRMCWFARTGTKAVTEKNVESEVASGIIVGSAVEAFNALLTEIYLPFLAANEDASNDNKQSISEFLQVGSGQKSVPRQSNHRTVHALSCLALLHASALSGLFESSYRLKSCERRAQGPGGLLG